MRVELFRSLAALPSLDPSHAASSAVPCKVCGCPARFFDVVDFNKCADGYTFAPSGISVPWFQCDACEFLFTPFFDDWTEADFSRFVYNSDYMLVDAEYSGARPARLVDVVTRLLGQTAELRLLDYGSGAGVLVRGLRERGYDAHGYDPFSSPRRPDGLFDVVTCFEVIEHSPDPMALLRDISSFLKNDGCIILGEALQPLNIDEIRCNWWYCAPRNGHCSTFSARTLALAAERIGWSFHPGGPHAFTSREGGRIAEMLERKSGPRLTFAMLSAPAGAPAPGWHGIEQPQADPFRWTASDAITWHVPFRGTGMLDLQVPVRMAIRSDFLKNCRILVEGREIETVVRKAGLAGRASGLSSTDGEVTVELRTPTLHTPREVRGAADDRSLGLAVPVLQPALVK